jgi:RNase P protein component
VCPHSIAKRGEVGAGPISEDLEGKGENQTEHFRFPFAPTTYPFGLGIAVGKRVGKTVERNRLKRIIREVFRQEGSPLALV